MMMMPAVISALKSEFEAQKKNMDNLTRDLATLDGELSSLLASLQALSPDNTHCTHA